MPERKAESRKQKARDGFCPCWLSAFRLPLSALAALALLVPTASAGHIRLKSGMVLTGKPSKMISLTHAVDPNPGPTTVYSVIQVQTGYQRYFVPFRQVPEDGLNFDAPLVRDAEFAVPHAKRSRDRAVRAVGGFVEKIPFDEQFGVRTVTLQTSKGPIDVVQRITRITPEYVQVMGETHAWDFGLGLSQVPQSTIVSILNNPVVCPPDDSGARMARARFYIQAGWYPQADAELAAYARDFPDFADRANELRKGLVQLFGQHVLRELQRRREAGQFRLGEESAQKLMQSPLGGGVQRDVQRFLIEDKQAHESLTKTSALLGDLQAKLGDAEAARNVSSLRSQLMKELDRAGLNRLQAFLQAESDPQLSADEKLALAYSGWILGADAAESNLLLAQQLWEARALATEFLRADDPAERARIFEQMRNLEGVGTKRLERLLRTMPPVRDAETVTPGTAARIAVNAANGESATAYWVVLPPEYSPNREYPCLVALHPQGRSAELAATLWGGTVDDPGWCQRRGYIVIAPEYAPEGTREYTYNVAAHSSVLESLRDARLRFAIDSDRVFLTGHDLGADAAFDIGLSHPDEFAGVIPIAGVADLYCQFYIENGSQTAWYVVRGELGRDSTKGMAPWLDRMFRSGAKYDLIYAQYPGRGQELYADEFPRIMDWMDLHRRGPPPREFEFRSLRQTDNRIHFVTALDLPRTVLLHAPGVERGGDVMDITARINEGNTIYVKSPAKSHRIQLIAGVVDFDRRVSVSINGKSRFLQKFVQPDPFTLLEDLRTHGDRKRIASAVLEF